MVEFTMQKLATKGLHNLTWEHRGINVENKQRKTVYRSRKTITQSRAVFSVI